TRRPPPSSTLFPYTTLFRSRQRAEAPQPRGRGASSFEATGGKKAPDEPRDAPGDDQRAVGDRDGNLLRHALDKRFFHPHHAVARSEEHTSELQSLAYLVCRL